MTRSQGSMREVRIQLLSPAPSVDDRRLDDLHNGSSRRLLRVHHMFMLLAATDIQLERHEWFNFRLPQAAGSAGKEGHDFLSLERPRLEQLCAEVNLALSVKPWCLMGPLVVDTRLLLELTDQLEQDLSGRHLRRSMERFRAIRAAAPLLREDELPSSWPLAKLVNHVSDKVPPDVVRHAGRAEEYRRLAVETTRVGRLTRAVRRAKRELPARLLEWLIDEQRLDEANEVLLWMDRDFARSRGLERRLNDAVRSSSSGPTLVDRPTWVGIEGGASHTAIAALTHVGSLDEVRVAVGLGGAMSDDALFRSAQTVMARLQEIVGHESCQTVVGCAGYDPDNPSALLRTLADARAPHRIRSDLWVGNDGDLLLFAPPILGSGVAVVADAGTVVVGRRPDDPDGLSIRRGGDEWLLADRGSGYEIAVFTLREILDRANRLDFEQRLDPDTAELIQAAKHAFGIPNPPAGSRVPGSLWIMRQIARRQALHWDKSVIASFAPKVVKLAEEGNARAARLVTNAAGRLGRHLAEVLCWHPDASPRIVVVGYLPVESSLYDDGFRSAARAHLSTPSRGGGNQLQKLAGLDVPAIDGAEDARVPGAAPLFAELARMLSAVTASELTRDEAAVIEFLRSERNAIVEHMPQR